MTHLLDYLADRVLLCDGAMGTEVQAQNLDIVHDFHNHENCTEILTESRPDLVREIHRGYLAAGSDAIQTNSFGGSPITLNEFGIAEKAFALNKLSAELARETVAEFAHDGRTRFVIGSLGPGTRLPSLGHIAYQPLEDALTLQCDGLIAGGVDAILIETCQDPLQIKAAVNGAKRARGTAGLDIPIFVQVTVETTGTLLVGADIAAAATIIDALAVDGLGLNCATGPREMAEHVKWLGENWPRLISIQPNAGLPELVSGRTQYPLSPEELAQWLERFVLEDGANIIGGCCGTEPRHIAALDAMLKRIGRDRRRPMPKARKPAWAPSVASLYGQVSLRQENAYLSIGERCNANGSRAFRRLQEQLDWDGCVEMGREQVKEGSHTLDLCTAFVGRDEVSDMTEMVTRMRGAVNAPLVLDSTEYPVLDAALQLYGGKPIINSINFEDGEDAADKRLKLARKYGAAVIALTIDERGMAKEVDDKIAVAKRLYEFACVKHGLPPSDLLFDPLTFTIATGNEDDRKLGLNTLDAIERIAKELPECQIILGLSNISFGLNPPARQVLNSVFLDHALKRGMTGAIVHFSRILPQHRIPAEEWQVAEDLIFDRRREGYDPLQAFLALFEDRTIEKAEKQGRPEAIEERLAYRIVEGDRLDLEADLDLAMQSYPPLEIINEHLLGGMKTVGDLFGAGKMQLPFVLQSAETMKSAVKYLEPFMERVEGQEKGTVVLATVRGDVHDIGKNLVDIILTNNGYRVVNLGIKQPIGVILDAAKEHKAHAIGMSGLLVKSTVVMRENLEEMSRAGLDVPVMLGGAALTRRYVEDDCVKAYESGRVAYARDAFDGLALMDRIVGNDFDGYLAEVQEKNAGRPKNEVAQTGPRRRRAAAAAGRPRGNPHPPRRADQWGSRAAAAVLGRQGAGARAGQVDRAVSQRAHALSIPMGLPEGRPQPRRVQEMGAQRAAPGAVAGHGAGDPPRDPSAAGGLWLLAVRRARQCRGAVRPRRRRPGGRALRVPAPEQERRPVHRRFLPRHRQPRARRDRPPGGDHGQPRVGGRARMVRRRPLPGLPLSARALGRDGRGLRRIRPQAHPRRIGFRRRGGARPRRDAGARLSRESLFLRLSRLSKPHRPSPAPGAAARRRDRPRPHRRRPARPRAIDLGHRGAPPAG